MRNGAITANSTSRFSRQAQRGRAVRPMATITSSTTENTRKPTKQASMVDMVFLKNSRITWRASSVRPRRM